MTNQKTIAQIAMSFNSSSIQLRNRSFSKNLIQKIVCAQHDLPADIALKLSKGCWSVKYFPIKFKTASKTMLNKLYQLRLSIYLHQLFEKPCCATKS
jgi:hypothetical protein